MIANSEPVAELCLAGFGFAIQDDGNIKEISEALLEPRLAPKKRARTWGTAEHHNLERDVFVSDGRTADGGGSMLRFGRGLVEVVSTGRG